MSGKHKIRDQQKLHFVSFAVVYRIDVFTRREYKDILIESLRYSQTNKGLELYAYCIMSNHVHLILGTNGKNKIQDILREIKKFTAVKIIKAINLHPFESRKAWMLGMFERAGKANSNNKKYQFRRQDNHPIELSNNSLMEQKLDYVPVPSGGYSRKPSESWYSFIR